MKKFLISLLVLAILGSIAAYTIYNSESAMLKIYGWLYDDCVSQKTDLYISKNSTYEEVLAQIHKSINQDEGFNKCAEYVDLASSFHTGHYVLSKGMNVSDIVRMLRNGNQTPVNVTINNAKTPALLAKKIEGKIDADSTEIVSVIGNDDVAKSYGFKNALEMYSVFIPNTYEFYWDTSVEDFLARMFAEYDKFWTEERDQKRERSGLSRMEVMTLASIVYEETRQSDEMPRVAGVYMNRLRKGMPLQADPTIKYALQDFSLRRILNKHLKHPSPYNTYLNKGLPPTPICMPGISAINAVLDYEEHNYLYFCARETFDGHHNFAATYDQHLQNARRYQRELNKRGIR